MALRVGYGFRLGGGVGVFFGGSGAVWIFLAIGSMRLMLALVFMALVSLLTLMRFAGRAAEQSASGRRRRADQYLRTAVNWDVAAQLSEKAVPLWGVYAIGDIFFRGRHPRRKEQLRAAYPDRCDDVVSVAVFPSADLARSCAMGLQRHRFSGRELMALYGYRVTAADAEPPASVALPGAAGA